MSNGKYGAAANRNGKRPDGRSGKKKTSGTGKTAIRIISLILVLLIAAGIAGGVAWFLIKQRKASAITVAFDGATYTQDAEGLFIYPETEIKVTSKSGDGGYTVKITATSEWKDFDYIVGAEPYKWSNMDGADFTEQFKMKKTQEGFILSYESVQAVIAGYYSHTVHFPEEFDYSGSLFKMEIKSGTSKLTLAFGLGVTATGIEFDKTQIVM